MILEKVMVTQGRQFMLNLLNINLDEKSISNILQWISKTVKDNYMRIILILLLAAISFGVTAYNNYKMVLIQEKKIVELELENKQYRDFFAEYNPKIDTIYVRTTQLSEENKDLKQENKFLNFLCDRK